MECYYTLDNGKYVTKHRKSQENYFKGDFVMLNIFQRMANLEYSRELFSQFFCFKLFSLWKRAH